MTKPKDDVRSLLASHMMRVREAIVSRLSEIGELSVALARASGNYTDRTGNLRSSIGYVVAENGVVLASSSFGSILGASEGPRKGRALANEIASQSRGLVLILVAGIDYAQYVADKGFDVLDSGDILARQLVRHLNVPKVSW